MNKKLIPAILGGLGILGISSQALAYEVFTVDPNAVMGTSTYSTFQADAISGTTSGRIILDGDAKTATEKGYVQFDTFKLNGSGVSGAISRLDVVPGGFPDTYGMYLTFDLSVSYDASSTGPFGGAKSLYDINTLTFSLWADPNLDTTFTEATLTTDAVVGGSTGDDLLLASGSLVRGSAAINDDGGVGINATTTFDLTTPDGKNFFINPDPFYNFMFSGANNTSAGVDYPLGYDLSVGCPSGICNVALLNSVLTVDFAGEAPEPATLALLGIGLFGLGASRFRKQA